MQELKFDKEIHSKFEDIAIIDYGIVEGNNIIVFIKAGQNGSLYGYQNKYIKMAKRLNKKYECSVICSSNPFDGNNPLDNAMKIIEDYAKKFDDYKIYYLGYSNGALIGAWFGIKYPKIKRMVLVNGPLMYNLYKTKEGALSFKGESINFIYGEYDQSIEYVELLKSIENDKIKVFIEEGQDHHFSKSEEDFQKIPEKYLFEMNPEK
ncbi:MAG: alpha/beta hydrolase [Bacilli bacterium]